MKSFIALSLCLGIASLGMPAVAAAADTRIETTSIPGILENLDSIDAAMAANDPRLQGLSAKDREQLKNEQRKVRTLLAGKQTLAELNGRDRLTAFNTLERIHGLVTGNREDRVVCRKDHVVGSNRPQTTCMTASEREQARNNAVQAMAVRGQMLRQEGL